MKQLKLKRFASIFAFFGIVGVIQSSQADVVQVDGFAFLQGKSLETARKEAYKDALRQISMRGDANVTSTITMMKDGVSQEHTKIKSKAVIRKVKILEEKAQHGQYMMRVQGDISPIDSCQLNGSPYKKRVAVMSFPVIRPLDVQDMPNIAKEFSEGVQEQLRNQNFIVIDQSQYQFPYSYKQFGLLNYQPEIMRQVQHVADNYSAQFVVAGFITNMSTDLNQGRQKAWENIDFPPLFNQLLKYEPTKRYLEIEYFLFDGLTGHVIAQKQFNQFFTGNRETLLNIDKLPVQSPGFLSTSLGQEIDKLMKQVSGTTFHTVKCMPLQARIVKIEGNTLYLNIGGINNINVGDTFVAYTNMFPLYNFALNYTHLGNVEKRMGRLTIKQVQPLLAVAEFEPAEGFMLSGGSRLKVGDLIRYDDIAEDNPPPLKK